jgi:hemerythrin-like domain-containing protein
MTQGTAILRAEHEQVLRVLAVAERMAERAANGVPPAPADVEVLLALVTQFIDQLHHAREELHLFPLLERKGLPRAGGPIGVMLAEHEHGRALIGEIARLRAQPDSQRPWSEAVYAYCAHMRQHIGKENTILFVMAERLLSAEEQNAFVQSCTELDTQSPGSEVRARLNPDLARLEQAYPARA